MYNGVTSEMPLCRVGCLVECPCVEWGAKWNAPVYSGVPSGMPLYRVGCLVGCPCLEWGA